MDKEYRLRSARPSDEPAIRDLVFKVLREHGLAPDPTTTDSDLSDLDAAYVRPGGLFEVVVDGTGEVVGTVGLLPLEDGRCGLRKLYVAKEHRGRGLGKRLVEYALEKAKALGFRRVELETAGVLEVAKKLYESFGFRPFVPTHLSARSDRAYALELGDEAVI